MQKNIRNYKYILIGLPLCVFGYGITVAFDLDFYEKVTFFLMSLEMYELDDLILWMLIFSVFAIVNIVCILEKKELLKSKKIYDSMLYASNHILRNFVNQAQILKIQAEESKDIDKSAIKMFNDATDEAKKLVKKLSEIDSIKKENIDNSIR